MFGILFTLVSTITLSSGDRLTLMRFVNINSNFSIELVTQLYTHALVVPGLLLMLCVFLLLC